MAKLAHLAIVGILLLSTQVTSSSIYEDAEVEVAPAAPPLSKSGGFFNVGSYFSNLIDKFGGGYAESQGHSVYEERCRDMSFKGGRAKFVNGSKCYEFFIDKVTTKVLAEAACVKAGGKLWTPDLFDGDIWQCFFVEFPAVFASNMIWSAIMADASVPVKVLSGTTDFTNAPYIKASAAFTANQCAVLNFQLFTQATAGPCTIVGGASYVCEYDIGFMASTSSHSGYGT